MGKHTPGPWTVEWEWADDGPFADDAPKLYWIEPVPIPETGQFELEADARLAAAAPDLLAACEALVDVLETHALEPGDGIDDLRQVALVLRGAYAAVAKAKGDA